MAFPLMFGLTSFLLSLSWPDTRPATVLVDETRRRHGSAHFALLRWLSLRPVAPQYIVDCQRGRCFKLRLDPHQRPMRSIGSTDGGAIPRATSRMPSQQAAFGHSATTAGDEKL